MVRGGPFITLHHTFDPTNDEGRGVHFFDLLAGFGSPIPGDTATSNLNSQRIADELMKHRFATGSVPVEIRPLVVAIGRRCFEITGRTVIDRARPTRFLNLPFFDGRNGMNIEDLVIDTTNRSRTLPRRKADIQRMNLDRLQFDGSPDPYLSTVPPFPNGLLQQNPPTPTATPDVSLTRLRQEVFRRPTNRLSGPNCRNDIFCADNTVTRRMFVDREVIPATLIRSLCTDTF